MEGVEAGELTGVAAGGAGGRRLEAACGGGQAASQRTGDDVSAGRLVLPRSDVLAR
jgi:hypothetical protein